MTTQQTAKEVGRWRASRWRRLAALVSGVALVAGALLVPAPAAHAAEDSGLETWGPDTLPSNTHSFEETTPWARVFPSSSRGDYLVLQQDGDLVHLNWEGAQTPAGDIPAEVDNGGIRDAAYVTNLMAVAVTADGALHKWGETAGIVLANGVWTPEDLGGQATAVAAGIRSAVVTLDTGHVVEVSNFGVSEVQRDGAPLTGVEQIGGGRFLLEDGTVGRVRNGAWETSIPADPADPVADVSGKYAVTESGRILSASDGSEVAFMPDLDPEVDGKPIRATGVEGTALLLTDKGKLVAWVPSSGDEPPNDMQIPEVVANGTVRELIQGASFAVWMGEEPPVQVSTPSSIAGTAQVGSELTGTPATFTGDPDSTSVEWRDAETDEVLGTEATYTPTAEDLGRTIILVTTAHKDGQEDVVSVSEPVGPVLEETIASTTELTANRGQYGKVGTARVTVDAAGDAEVTGSVTVTINGRRAKTVDLVDGAATVRYPRKLNPGRYQLEATYAGSATVEGSTATTTYRVAKAKPARPRWKAKAPTTKRKGKARVTVRTPRGLAKANGKVRVKLRKGKAKKQMTRKIRRGRSVFKIPRLQRGRWKVRVIYLGDRHYKRSVSKKYILRVRRR